MSRRGLTFALTAALVGILAVLAWVLPVPYVVLVPGPATDTLGAVPGTSTPVVSVQGAQTFPTSGKLYLTTVGVIPGSCDSRPPTLIQTMKAWFDKTKAVEPRQIQCPPGETSTAVQQQNEHDMEQSQQDAITAALLQLGYKPATEQVVVGSVTAGTPAASKLQADDQLVSVDGQAVTSDAQLRQLIGAHPVGTTLTITIDRNGKRQNVSVQSIDSGPPDHHPIIGIEVDVHATFTTPKVHIGIDPAQVGGPSAGLMFALGIIDKLTQGGITGGRVIAGTGEITGAGVVKPIGGIQQKLAAATASPVKASVFLAPSDDCAEAKAVAPKSLILVRVQDLSGALDALKAITSGTGTYPRC